MIRIVLCMIGQLLGSRLRLLGGDRWRGQVSAVYDWAIVRELVGYMMRNGYSHCGVRDDAGTIPHRGYRAVILGEGYVRHIGGGRHIGGF